MTMEDKQLKDIFNKFDPELPSDFSFLSRLQQNLDAVDMVKQENQALRRRSRMAVAVAAAVGVIVGSLLTLLMPFLGDWMSTIVIPDRIAIAIDYKIVGLMLMAAVSVVSAVNTYEIAMSLFKNKK